MCVNKDKIRERAIDEVLPELEDGHIWCCGNGHGECTPVQRDFAHYISFDPEDPEEVVEIIASKVWVADCCDKTNNPYNEGLMVWDNNKDRDVTNTPFCPKNGIQAMTSRGEYNTEKPAIEVEHIIIQHLRNNKYDGLSTDSCGCELSNLATCGNGIQGYCRPSYKHTKPNGIESDYSFLMSPSKETPSKEDWST